MKNSKRFLLFVALSVGTMVIGSQTDSDSENIIHYLVSSQTDRNYLVDQNSEEAQINDGYNFSQATTSSRLFYQSTAVQDPEYNAPRIVHHYNKAALSHVQTQQEQIPLTQYSLASATQQAELSQASTVSTLIDPVIVSSQSSNASAQIHRAEELTYQSQHAQGDSYLYRVSSDEDN